MEITFGDKIVSINFNKDEKEYKFFKVIFNTGLDIVKEGIKTSRQLSPTFEKEAQKIINKERDGLLLVETGPLVYGIEIESLIFILSMAESYLVAWSLMDASKKDSDTERKTNLVLKREITEILNFLKDEKEKQES